MCFLKSKLGLRMEGLISFDCLCNHIDYYSIYWKNKYNALQCWSFLFTVTPECPQEGQHFFISLDELEFLSQLIKSFLKLEKNVQELFEEIFLSLKIPRNNKSGNIDSPYVCFLPWIHTITWKKKFIELFKET